MMNPVSKLAGVQRASRSAAGMPAGGWGRCSRAGLITFVWTLQPKAPRLRIASSQCRPRVLRKATPQILSSLGAPLLPLSPHPVNDEPEHDNRDEEIP
jgi:hypothetical protein